MREHGVLNRVLLIYEHYERRLGRGEGGCGSGDTHSAAGIIRHFIEEYTKSWRRSFISAIREGGQTRGLVKTLREQHQRAERPGEDSDACETART